MNDPISNESYYKILNEIAIFLNCNLKTRKQISTGNEYYNITASSKQSLFIIINYLNTYPLYSSKYLDYKDWKQEVELILKNEHLTNNGIIKADLLKNSMNIKRTYYNWDHLD